MDKEVAELIRLEAERQRNTLNLIASENHTSRAVREANGSVFTEKYSEGYPGKRYYAGCEIVDQLENHAINLAKKLFDVDYVNLQPYSGSSANLATYAALAGVGGKIMGQALSDGGHLTHGSKASLVSSFFQFKQYGVDQQGWIDYDKLEKLAKKFQPKVIVAGTSAYPRLIDWDRLRQIADQINAYLMADIAHLSGLVAGKAIPSPVGIADVVTSTTQKSIRGPRGGMIMTNNQELAIKIDRAVFPGLQGGPHQHSIAAKAQAFYEALQPEFAAYANQVLSNANTLARSLQDHGVELWSDGTDTHLLVFNSYQAFGLNGLESKDLLAEQGIITSQSQVPNDPLPPMLSSGVRLGTSALSTRGMQEDQMQEIAEVIVRILRDKANLRSEILGMAKQFKLPE
ncbi:serine hydroxymethyltransferase [Candidatus Saccharibacteria bacterium]|nr:serine hydroxymethyltransferase [Candidatus Saccharibacteria bacterium]MCB9834891.1 serine hydroxymethyltransferase [Candidatus Nomurabacteria bacterium]